MDKTLDVLDNSMVELAKAISWESLLNKVQMEFISAHHYCRRITNKWQPPIRTLPDEQFHLVHQGTFEYVIGGKSSIIGPRHVVFCPAGIPWVDLRHKVHVSEMTIVHFQARFPGGIRFLDAFRFPYYIPLNPVMWRGICALGAELSHLHKNRPAGHALRELMLLHDFLHRLFPKRGEVGVMDRNGERVLKVIEFMKMNYHQPLTQETLGRQAFVSASHLGTIFRQYTGYSPIDYLIRMRMQEARNLLVNPDLSIAEVGRRVGYEDQAYFSRLFKKNVGIPPLDYRAEHPSELPSSLE